MKKIVLCVIFSFLVTISFAQTNSYTRADSIHLTNTSKTTVVLIDGKLRIRTATAGSGTDSVYSKGSDGYVHLIKVTSGSFINNSTTLQTGATFNIKYGRADSTFVIGHLTDTTRRAFTVERLVSGVGVTSKFASTLFPGSIITASDGINPTVGMGVRINFEPFFTPDNGGTNYNIWNDHRWTHDFGDSTFVLKGKSGPDSLHTSVNAKMLQLSNSHITYAVGNIASRYGSELSVRDPNSVYNGLFFYGPDGYIEIFQENSTGHFKGFEVDSAKALFTNTIDGAPLTTNADTAQMSTTPTAFVTNEWVLGHLPSGGGTTIYTGDASLTGDRTVSLNGHSLDFNDTGVDLFMNNVSEPEIGASATNSNSAFNSASMLLDAGTSAGNGSANLHVENNTSHLFSDITVGINSIVLTNKVDSTAAFYSPEIVAKYTSDTLQNNQIPFWGYIKAHISGGGTTTHPLTLGYGILGTSFDGSAAVTAKSDTSVLQTILNLFPKTDTRYYTKTASDARYEVPLTFTSGLTRTSNTVKADTSFLQTVLNFFPKGDTRYAKISALPTATNPTASAGTTAVNGSATTFMRSDGAPKVDSAIFTTKALISTYLTKAQIVATYAPLVSPSLTTPTLGVATATSINKVAMTAPATSATLTIANGKTLTVNNTITFTGTDATTMTLPGTSQTLASLAGTETFTNKTLTTPIINVGSDATGDIYYRNSSGLFTRLPIASSNNVLTITGGIPAWGNNIITGSMQANSGYTGPSLVNGSGNTVLALQTGRTFSIAADVVSIIQTETNSSGIVNVLNVSPTINQTSTGGTIGFKQNWTNTVGGSGIQQFVSFGVGGTEKFGITTTGAMTLPVILKGYTVSGLPTGVTGMTAYVTDALTPVALGTVTGGGSSVVPVFYNGSNWIVQ